MLLTYPHQKNGSRLTPGLSEQRIVFSQFLPAFVLVFQHYGAAGPEIEKQNNKSY
jgi:hypothetical protein